MSRRWFVLTVAIGLAVVAVMAASLWSRTGRDTAHLAEAERRHCNLAAADPSAPHPGMVWVEGGRFTMGDTFYPEETLLHDVEVDGFWMDRTEVTNAEFAAFVADTGYVTVAERPVDEERHPNLPPAMRKPGAVVFVMPNDVRGTGDISQWWQYIPGANWRQPGGPGTSIDGKDDFPVTAVAYEDALAYAEWKGRSLPTEAQWEWAARERKPEVPQDRTQPREANTWQGLFPVINQAEDGFVGIAPAGCFEPNALGLYDMIGNLWEWTSDGYEGAPGSRVIKGGSWLCAPSYCLRYRPGARQPQEADLATTHLGFRTVLSPSS
ncbi:formylglycine-generating enzyme family protein [Parvibaculum sp.]|jgi:formylglycine-generating enzyme|uniref:formylglycine-generating enzyme family protein n=3 Tax=Parvibaculum sp. TaxID=2024848 RepID=UPI001B2E6753|nr:formylglycine-generating enzyme family protein [Parvibaculum sp.]MBO6678829.1 formylglycine-generating enzyme family protein [Parvibaculum sp.]MBO6683761.1 formylglycine-generating enzyme family protein [Parvibaculum sp.]MBO6903963.1 formylglycine-generating enzyme family protein [Parvibaculum sp.]